MRQLVATLFGAGILVLATAAHTGEVAATGGGKAAQVASAWFVSLMQGETAVTTSLSAVPFDLDGKRLLESLTELEEVYEGIVADKGRRGITRAEITVGIDVPERTGDACSDDEIAILLMIETEGVAVCIRPGDALKVVGFRD